MVRDKGTALAYTVGSVIFALPLILMILILLHARQTEAHIVVTVIGIIEAIMLGLILPSVPRYSDIEDEHVVVKYVGRTARICRLSDIEKVYIVEKIPLKLIFWPLAYGNRGAFGAAWCGLYKDVETCVYTRRTRDLIMLEIRREGKKTVVILQPRDLQEFLNKLPRWLVVERLEQY